MKRKRLERFLGKRLVFRAVFQTFGKKHLDGHVARYMLIYNVVDERGKHITRHMWMPLTKKDSAYWPLERGDAIQFTAEVKTYFKGSERRIMDYGLRKPRDVVRIEQLTEKKEA